MSPGRKQHINQLKEKLQKKYKPSPLEIKEKSDIRQKRAEFKRNIKKIQKEEQFMQKRRRMKKAKEVVELQKIEKKKAIELQISLKQSKADERYEAHLNSIRNRAKSENLKPNEVAFILELQADEKKISLEEKKMIMDNRISETRERRAKVLESVQKKKVDRMMKEEAAEKRRQALQNEKGIKYVYSLQKIEEAETRRNQILEIKKNTAEDLSKKRLKKIKQVYNSRALKHDKASIMGKEATGVNKNRLQKLSLDLDKCITNIIDYETAGSVLKDTIKLLDQRKEADLHVIRQLKFIPCIMEIVKKV